MLTKYPGETITMSKPAIAHLHYLTQDHIPGMTHAALAKEACQGGINWIQLRTKDKSEAKWEALAISVQKIAKTFGATLIINDNVNLALKIQADGVHLGKEDMDPVLARNILGHDFIIGGTANNEDDIKRLVDAGVDYIGLGPYRYTQTKKNLSPILHKNELERLLGVQNEIPVLLIGGILESDIPIIAAMGANGIAVSSGINLSKSPAASAESFAIETLKHFNK
jgi:thiamine-phosphate pyrophosphorylase